MLDVPAGDIRRPTRGGAAASEARHVAAYLANVVFQVTFCDIAGEFRRDRTSIAHALHRVEDRREEPGFDRLIERAEILATTMLQMIERAAR